MKYSLSFLALLLILSCKDEIKPKSDVLLPNTSKLEALELKYAKGFSVTYYNDYKVLTVLKPWPNANKTFKYLLASSEALSKMTYAQGTYDGVITNTINRIVVTSTTNLPALELLKVDSTLVGFPGTDYISSEHIRTRVDNKQIRELGKNEGINTEVLLDIKPDLVVGFTVNGANKTFETIKKANIPVVYNAGWVESSALAKAEWIKFFGVLYNKEKEADSIFNTIEKDYNEAKKIAKAAKSYPTVLSGAMSKGIWHLPNGNSPEAQFLKDANVNYLWKNTSGNGSLSLSFETVLDKAKNADLWLSPSYYRSLKHMEDNNPLYTNFEAFKNKNIYSFTNTIGTTGGVLYYELGTARPDLVLKDIIKICHPELLKDYSPYFFKKMN